jgi:NADH:ubiquinone oxidoreductase subunit H
LGILGFILILITNIVLMLVLTIIIAALTLIERKFLALVQRRVGPQFVGYKGRLQYIADALKLFIKGALVPDEANKFWFITIPAVVAAICYSFWMNAVWGPSISLFEIEYNMVYASLFSVLFGICVLLTGYFSKNKYAVLAAVRTGIGMLNLEIFLGLLILNVVFVNESFSFLPIVIYQEVYWLIFYFFGLIGLITITFLLETSRAPFDLSEAESELVAGYQTEYGGFFFGLYYLGEYMHLFFFSLVISTLFLGGWELPNFIIFYNLPLFNIDGFLPFN